MKGSTLSIAYQASAIQDITRRLHSFCRALDTSDTFNFQCRLVVAETLNNIIEHSPKQGSSEFIQVNFSFWRRQLILSFVYWSPLFKPPEATVCVARTALSGRGWHIIRHYMDDVCYNHWMGMNTLILKKHLP